MSGTESHFAFRTLGMEAAFLPEPNLHRPLIESARIRIEASHSKVGRNSVHTHIEF